MLNFIERDDGMIINENRLFQAMKILKINNIKFFPDSEMLTPSVLIERESGNNKIIDCGKGENLKNAFYSALFESFERYSAEHFFTHEYYGSSVKLRECINLCSPSSLYPFNPMSIHADSRELYWSKGYDLLSDKECYVPTECIAFPSKSSFSFISTIGLASGQSYIEAIIHAIYEAIEHDTLSTHLIAKQMGSRLKIKNKKILTLLQKFNDKRIDIEVRYLENIYGIPCVITLMRNAPHFEKNNIAGMGCNLNLDVAIMRSITECQQSYDYWYNKYSTGSLIEKGIVHPPLELNEEFSLNNDELEIDHEKIEFKCNEEELECILDRLKEYITKLICIDITHKDLLIPTVKVMIPDFLETIEYNYIRLKGKLLSEALKNQGDIL